MASIGDRALLTVLREAPMGVFLDAGEHLGEVLLPKWEVPKGTLLGGKIDVFLYRDSEDRPIATRQEPKVRPGCFGFLEAVQVNETGTFLDWGLPKEILLPFAEQKERCEAGKSYVVFVDIDEETDRIVASRRLSRYFKTGKPPYEKGQEVDLLIFGKSDLGYKAIIDDDVDGVLYYNTVFRELRLGERTKGYVAKVRENDKVDLTLYPPQKELVDQVESELLEALRNRGGSIALTDKSSPEDIHAAFGVSKKAFKRAVGGLYKKRLIELSDSGVSLAD